MPSPFPGMNPYLEHDDAWHDFHERFIPVAAEWLNAQAGPGYIVWIDEQIYVHEADDPRGALLGRADVAVVETADLLPARGSASSTALAPVSVRLPVGDVEAVSYIEIRDRRSRQLVTVLELLSPSNKRLGRDRQQYLHKRLELLASPVHFVELDLLRGYARMPVADLPPCDYYALVSRAAQRPAADLWPIRLRDRLPDVPIPLRDPDEQLKLEMQSILHHIHDSAGYAKFIYDSEPDPPLPPEEQAWAKELAATARQLG